MKGIARVVGVLVLFVTTAAFAANIDGSYTFKSRVKEGQPEMAGWTGTMKIANGIIFRDYVSGSEKKFYEATIKNEGGDIYALTITKSYKPEQVGTGYKNKVTLSANGQELFIESTDGKFKETWFRK